MLSKHHMLLPCQINGVYSQNDIKRAIFSAISAWGYFSSLFINFTDTAIDYVSVGRAVNPLCVCMHTCDASCRSQNRIDF